MNEAHAHCHRCGTAYGNESWPRKCPGCGSEQYNNPTPIGVLLQTVTDGSRVGILTPIRGHAPMIGHPGGTGGFQEAADRSFRHSGCREYGEEIRLGEPTEDECELLIDRTSGPHRPVGRRQTLVFSVNHTPVHISAYDAFVPDQETTAIDFSWKPRVLAFPTHTLALAIYFQKHQGMNPPSHLIDQPRTDDRLVDGRTVYDVPYDQPLLHAGIWTVLVGRPLDTEAVSVIRRTGIWHNVRKSA